MIDLVQISTRSGERKRQPVPSRRSPRWRSEGSSAACSSSYRDSNEHHCEITIQEVRRLALALPEAVEQEHWGNPSFRISGKIFATVPDAQHVNVMPDPFAVEPAARTDPATYQWR